MSKDDNHLDKKRMDRIQREAADWVIKRAYGLTAEEQDAFFDWLGADPEHAEAFTIREQTWKGLDALAEWRPEHSDKPNPDLLDSAPEHRFRRSRVRPWLLGMAAILALGCGLWFGGLKGVFTGPTQLSSGEFARGYERHVLEDGSIVELNLGSQASVDISRSQRHVFLESGEAHFTVAKDVNRPFVVWVNGIAVEAVGTIFNVQLHENRVDVLVTEGRVRVASSDERLEESLSQETVVDSFAKELTAGQQTVIEMGETVIPPQVLTLSEREVEEKLTWLKQVIHFEDAPLSEIILEFNLRNYRKLVIEDPDLQDLRLSVTLQPHNVDELVELLEVTSNIRAQRIGDSVIILRSN